MSGFAKVRGRTARFCVLDRTLYVPKALGLIRLAEERKEGSANNV